MNSPVRVKDCGIIELIGVPHKCSTRNIAQLMCDFCFITRRQEPLLLYRFRWIATFPIVRDRQDQRVKNHTADKKALPGVSSGPQRGLKPNGPETYAKL